MPKKKNPHFYIFIHKKFKQLSGISIFALFFPDCENTQSLFDVYKFKIDINVKSDKRKHK